MSLMRWDKNLSVGIPAIDEQHKKLIDMINELYDGMMNNQSRQALGVVLHKLSAYIDEHFQYEENLFEATDYPLKIDHKKEHDDFKAKAKELLVKYENTVTGVGSIDTLTFLKKWLITHIMVEDKKYISHLVAAGVR